MSLVNILKKKCTKTLFTTPSHSQRFCIFNKLRNLYKYDISETDYHNPQQALLEAEINARIIYGTKQTKFLTNGSSSGIISAVLACTNPGDVVLIWENAHPSHKNAITLSGTKPIYYKIPQNNEWGIPQKTTTEMLEPYFIKNEIKALIVTSPTYEGTVSDIKQLKNLCSKYKTYLIIDEAHGALYPFSNNLPESAVKIADFTIQSLHKTAGGLNPTALLHTTTNIDLNKALNLISTTSPSYPLLASIEKNINYLNSKKGRLKINQLISEIEDLKKQCPACRFGGDDITKILVKVEGLSGYELSELLYNQFNIEDEKTNDISTMLICGLGTSKNKIEKLKKALKSISKKD